MKKLSLSKVCRAIMLVLTIASLIGGGVFQYDLQRTITAKERIALDEDGIYNTKEDVADYIFKFGHLPSNYMTKGEAELNGWIGGNPEKVKEQAAIGGNRFYGESEQSIPKKTGRYYQECDVNTWGADERGSERIIFSNDGMILYTNDHYKTFEILYEAN